MRKKTISLFAVVLLFTAISCKDKASQSVESEVATTEVAVGEEPVMTFDESEFDFGNIKEGEIVEHIFKFKNTGKSDLLITDAKGSCGCTVPDYKKEAIKPGESSEMKVSFNSSGKVGLQQKTVTIAANTATGNELLTIKASVAPKSQGIGVAQ